MKSYFKSQWFSVLVGLVNLGLSIYYLAIGEDIWSLGWLLAATIWLVISRLEYSEERIKTLEEKSEKYDALVEKVEAMSELLETERKYADHLRHMIESVIETVEDIKHGD
jgi:hypothetical protein